MLPKLCGAGLTTLVVLLPMASTARPRSFQAIGMEAENAVGAVESSRRLVSTNSGEALRALGMGERRRQRDGHHRKASRSAPDRCCIWHDIALQKAVKPLEWAPGTKRLAAPAGRARVRSTFETPVPRICTRPESSLFAVKLGERRHRVGLLGTDA